MHPACLFISSMYAPEINLSHSEITREDLDVIDATIEKPGHWMQQQFHCTLTVTNCQKVEFDRPGERSPE